MYEFYDLYVPIHYVYDASCVYCVFYIYYSNIYLFLNLHLHPNLYCYMYSCIEENCSNLCQDCDKVFHKAASKRTHIRMPCAAVGPVDRPLMRSIVKLLPEELRYIVYGMQEWHFSSTSSNSGGIGSSKPSPSVMVNEVVALLFASIRGIIDDRRVRITHVDK